MAKKKEWRDLVGGMTSPDLSLSKWRRPIIPAIRGPRRGEPYRGQFLFTHEKARGA